MGSGCSMFSMGTRTNRLSTFANWPDTAPVSPEQLARAGFFYPGEGDTVRCAYCNLSLRDWVFGDDPITKHKKYRPHCQFLQQLDEKSAGLSGGTAEGHDNYCFPAGQTEEGLAAAGLFHTGPGDMVRCWDCNGCLNDWKVTDDPWIEHTRYFPTCPFVTSHRSDEYIHNVPDGIPTGHSGATGSFTGTSESRQCSAAVARSNSDPTPVRQSTSFAGAATASSGTKYISAVCIVCLDQPLNMVFLPCAHLLCCQKCSASVRRCPICRGKIESSFKIYLP